jgi:hypothetical protein
MLAFVFSGGLMSCSGLQTNQRVDLNTSWRVNVNGSANGSDFARAVAMTKAGDVVAGGFTMNSGSGYDFTVAKFSAIDGTELWRTIIDGTGSDQSSEVESASEVIVDAGDNVLAAGGIIESGINTAFTVVKLDSKSGKEVWRQVGARGFAQTVVADVDGNVVAAGSTNEGGAHDAFTVMKFDGITGAKLWSQLAKSDAYGVAGALATDRRGNVVAAGLGADAKNRSGFTVAKFDAATGTEIWRRVINGNVGGDWAVSVDVDLAGNVVAAGLLVVDFRTWDDFFIIKLSGVDGSEIWRKAINGAANGRDQALKVTVDSTGNVIGAGFIVNGDSDDLFVAKFEELTGRELWRQVINGRANGPDYAQAVKVAADGSVVAAGSLKNSPQDGDFAVVKFDGVTGKLLWQREFGGSA